MKWYNSARFKVSGLVVLASCALLSVVAVGSYFYVEDELVTSLETSAKNQIKDTALSTFGKNREEIFIQESSLPSETDLLANQEIIVFNGPLTDNKKIIAVLKPSEEFLRTSGVPIEVEDGVLGVSTNFTMLPNGTVIENVSASVIGVLDLNSGTLEFSGISVESFSSTSLDRLRQEVRQLISRLTELRASYDLQPSEVPGFPYIFINTQENETENDKTVNEINRFIALSPHSKELKTHVIQNKGTKLNIRNQLNISADRTLSASFLTNDGKVSIYSAYTTQSLENTLRTARSLFLIIIPGLALLLGVVAWGSVNRVLKPVEKIRKHADTYSLGQNQKQIDIKRKDEIGSLGKTINSMLSRLEAFSGKQIEFSENASHELRSPLTASKLHLELALENKTENDWNQTLSVLTEENEKMIKIINDLMVIAKNKEIHDADTIDVTAAIENLRNKIKTNNKLEIKTKPDIQAKIDKNHLDQILDNLIKNADRYAKTKITIKCYEKANKVIITCEDDGEGIPKEIEETLFERFVQADKSRTGSNAGLGLAISKELAEINEGTLKLSKSSSGAAFKLTLRKAE